MGQYQAGSQFLQLTGVVLPQTDGKATGAQQYFQGVSRHQTLLGSFIKQPGQPVTSGIAPEIQIAQDESAARANCSCELPECQVWLIQEGKDTLTEDTVQFAISDRERFRIPFSQRQGRIPRQALGNERKGRIDTGHGQTVRALQILH
jgi:hypothetical protein